LLEIGARTHGIMLIEQVIGAQEEMRARISRPQFDDTLGDFRCLVEHLELVVFRREKVKSSVVARVGGDLLFQNIDIAMVLSAARGWVGSEIMIDSNAGLPQPSTTGKNRFVDGFMHAPSVTVMGTVGKEPHSIICCRNGVRPVIVPFQEVTRVFIARDQRFDLRRAGGSQRLIGVENQDPWLGRLRETVIACDRKINNREIERGDLRPKVSRDARRRVSLSRIDHDQFSR